MVKSLLDRRNFAHLATILRHGSPHSGPCGWEAKATASACTDKDSVKARNRLRDPRVAISIVDLNDPYSEAQLRGRVVERRRDFDFKYIDAVSNK